MVKKCFVDIDDAEGSGRSTDVVKSENIKSRKVKMLEIAHTLKISWESVGFILKAHLSTRYNRRNLDPPLDFGDKSAVSSVDSKW